MDGVSRNPSPVAAYDISDHYGDECTVVLECTTLVLDIQYCFMYFYIYPYP
jgi:hypothetical protein